MAYESHIDSPGQRPFRADFVNECRKNEIQWLDDIAYFFGGAFLINGIPHFVSGLTGHAFQTPFARPPGKGYSSSTVNFLWGAVNFCVAYFLLARVGAFDIRSSEFAVATALGGLAIGLPLTKAFGAIHGGNTPQGR